MGDDVAVGGGVSARRVVVDDGIAVGTGDGVDVTGARATVEILETSTVLSDVEVRHAENSNSGPKSSKIKIWL